MSIIDDIPIHVVLVRPHYSRNVGSVSRVMANLGASQLFIIDAKCEMNLEARQGAAGAQSHLMEATHYKTLAEFYANEREGIQIAFSGIKKKETDSTELGDKITHLIKSNAFSGRPLYLIFGQEDHGLEKEDLKFVNFIFQLPIYGPFFSYNLSHAVLLALYICKTSLKNITPDDRTMPTADEPTKPEPFYFPDETIGQWLTELGFTIGDRRTDAYQVIKRLILGAAATAKELRILEAVIHQTVRKLKNK